MTNKRKMLAAGVIRFTENKPLIAAVKRIKEIEEAKAVRVE